MIRRMRPLWISLVLAAALALPLAALATDAPPPSVVSACQAEAAQLGKDSFVAKYGPTEPFGHCYTAHMPTATTTVSNDDPATAACKAEYLKLGAAAFIAKYGATETLGNCRAAHTQKPPATTDDPATAACKAEYLKLGADAFIAKYGATETLGNCRAAHAQKPAATEDAAKTLAQALCAKTSAPGQCAKAVLAKARQIVAACKASSGSSRDAFKACLVAATKRR